EGAGGAGGGGAAGTGPSPPAPSGAGSWNQLCRHLAQRTVRPSGPTALSGTTYRVAQAGQAIIMAAKPRPGRLKQQAERPPSHAADGFFPHRTAAIGAADASSPT